MFLLYFGKLLIPINNTSEKSLHRTAPSRFRTKYVSINYKIEQLLHVHTFPCNMYILYSLSVNKKLTADCIKIGIERNVFRFIRI